MPAVCDGDSHCSAAACGEVRYSTTTLVMSGVSVIVSGWPRMASFAPSAWLSVWPRASVTLTIVRSAVSSTSVGAEPVRAIVSVAVPASVFAAKSAARSSATCVTRASSGRAAECGSRTTVVAAGGVVGGVALIDGDAVSRQPVVATRQAQARRRPKRIVSSRRTRCSF